MSKLRAVVDVWSLDPHFEGEFQSLNVMTIRREQDGCTGGEYSKSERYGKIFVRLRWTPDTTPGMPAMISGPNGSPTKEHNPGLWFESTRSQGRSSSHTVRPHGDKAVVGFG